MVPTYFQSHRLEVTGFRPHRQQLRSTESTSEVLWQIGYLTKLSARCHTDYHHGEVQRACDPVGVLHCRTSSVDSHRCSCGVIANVGCTKVALKEWLDNLRTNGSAEKQNDFRHLNARSHPGRRRLPGIPVDRETT